MATLRHQGVALKVWNAFWTARDRGDAKAAMDAFEAFPRTERINGFGINEMHDALYTLEFGA